MEILCPAECSEKVASHLIIVTKRYYLLLINYGGIMNYFISHLRSIFCTTSFFLMILVISPNTSFAQIQNGSFIFDGQERDYTVFLPQDFQPNMPVVFNLHGYTDDAQWQMQYSLMNNVADTAGFIVIYPDAIYPGFNTGLVYGNWPPIPDINDVRFISALIDTIFEHYNVDKNRVYCCGYSNGGMMTFKLASELGHRFAAFASVAGVLLDPIVDNHNYISPLPILMFHGTNDVLVNYDGGPEEMMWSVETSLNFWINNNGCVSVPDTIALPDINPSDSCMVEKISYLGCDDETSVILYKVIDGGHSWPDSDSLITWSTEGHVNRDINANAEIWNYFKNFENPLVDIAYGKSIEVSPPYISQQGDTLKVNAILNNPENHTANVFAIIQGSESTIKDSIQLFDDGLHGDSEASDNIYGAMKWLSGLNEDMFKVNLRTTDMGQSVTTYLHYSSHFTAIGPVQTAYPPTIFVNYNEGLRRHIINLVLHNKGSMKAAVNLTATISTTDSRIESVPFASRSIVDISAGEIDTTTSWFSFIYAEGYGPDSTLDNPIQFDLTVSSNDFPYWESSFNFVASSAATNIENNDEILPSEFALYQNYPNPFNPVTSIEYQLSQISKVDLNIYNLLGQKVATLVSNKQQAGSYKVEWVASGFASGVYIYKISTDQGFSNSKKLLLIK